MILSEIKKCGADYNKMKHKLENITIDEFVKALIVDSDLEEVVSVLDFNAQQEGKQIRIFGNGKKIYPVV